MEQFIKELQELMKKHKIYNISVGNFKELEDCIIFYKEGETEGYYVYGDITPNTNISKANW